MLTRSRAKREDVSKKPRIADDESELRAKSVSSSRLALGAFGRMLPQELENATFSFLQVSDLVHLYLVSHALSNDIVRFLDALRVFKGKIDVAWCGTEAMAAALLIRHCRSLRLVNLNISIRHTERESGWRDPAPIWLSALVRANRATIRRVHSNFSTDLQVASTIASCPALEHFAYGSGAAKEQDKINLVRQLHISNLPALESMALGSMFRGTISYDLAHRIVVGGG